MRNRAYGIVTISGVDYDLSTYRDCDDFTSEVWFDFWVRSNENENFANHSEATARADWRKNA